MDLLRNPPRDFEWVGLKKWFPLAIPGDRDNPLRQGDGVTLEGTEPLWRHLNKWGPAAQFDDANSEWLEGDAGFWDGAPPLTMMCWFTRDASRRSVLVNFADASATNMQCRLNVGGPGLNDRIAITCWDGTTLDEPVGATDTTINKIHHAAAVFPSTSSRLVYLDGEQDGAGTATVGAIPLADRFGIGVSVDSTPFGYHSGFIADVRAYNRALNAAEIRAIYKRGSGKSPLVSEIVPFVPPAVSGGVPSGFGLLGVGA